MKPWSPHTNLIVSSTCNVPRNYTGKTSWEYSGALMVVMIQNGCSHVHGIHLSGERPSSVGEHYYHYKCFMEVILLQPSMSSRSFIPFPPHPFLPSFFASAIRLPFGVPILCFQVALIPRRYHLISAPLVFSDSIAENESLNFLRRYSGLKEGAHYKFVLPPNVVFHYLCLFRRCMMQGANLGGHSASGT